MKIIQHPNTFKEGFRILMLSGRHKDGVDDQRRIFRISHTPEKFDAMLNELIGIANKSERIYVTASPRDLNKAIRQFEVAQLNARFDNQIADFYSHLNARWVSALMSPKAEDKQNKVWLFDCDSDEDIKRVNHLLTDYEITKSAKVFHHYPTKNGYHFLISPFNFQNGHFEKLLMKNPLMLWAYDY